MSDAAVTLTSKKDWSSDQEVRWCPVCGDYGILQAVQQLMPELNRGQLCNIVRGKYLVDAKSVSKVAGVPFTTKELEVAIVELRNA